MTDRELMQQALEALEQYTNVVTSVNDPNSWVTVSDGGKPARDAITALRAAIEQAQEPVAWMYHGIRHDDTPHERPSLIWKPEYMDVMSAEKGAKATPLYTAPRQWQGLTDEERGQVINANFGARLWQMAKDIEAKLKEKNT